MMKSVTDKDGHSIKLGRRVKKTMLIDTLELSMSPQFENWGVTQEATVLTHLLIK